MTKEEYFNEQYHKLRHRQERIIKELKDSDAQPFWTKTQARQILQSFEELTIDAIEKDIKMSIKQFLSVLEQNNQIEDLLNGTTEITSTLTTKVKQQ